MKQSEVSRLFHEIDTDKSGYVHFISVATNKIVVFIVPFLLGA